MKLLIMKFTKASVTSSLLGLITFSASHSETPAACFTLNDTEHNVHQYKIECKITVLSILSFVF